MDAQQKHDFVTSLPEDPSQLQEMILEMDKKFRRACSQVKLLNLMVQGLHRRYNRAVRDNLTTNQYYLRLRICTSEAVCSTFYEYATQKAEKIKIMESRLAQMGVQPILLY